MIPHHAQAVIMAGWAPSHGALARAYLDQLERSKGLAADTIASTRAALAKAERRSASDRRKDLTQVAAQLNGAAAGSSDQAKVRLLTTAVTDLANAQR